MWNSTFDNSAASASTAPHQAEQEAPRRFLVPKKCLTVSRSGIHWQWLDKDKSQKQSAAIPSPLPSVVVAHSPYVMFLRQSGSSTVLHRLGGGKDFTKTISGQYGRVLSILSCNVKACVLSERGIYLTTFEGPEQILSMSFPTGSRALANVPLLIDPSLSALNENTLVIGSKQQMNLYRITSRGDKSAHLRCLATFPTPAADPFCACASFERTTVVSTGTRVVVWVRSGSKDSEVDTHDLPIKGVTSVYADETVVLLATSSTIYLYDLLHKTTITEKIVLPGVLRQHESRVRKILIAPEDYNSNEKVPYVICFTDDGVMLVFQWKQSDSDPEKLILVGGADVGVVLDAKPCGDHSLAMLVKSTHPAKSSSPSGSLKHSTGRNTAQKSSEEAGSKLLIWNARTFGIKLDLCLDEKRPILMEDDFFLTPTIEGSVRVKRSGAKLKRAKGEAYKSRYWRLYYNRIFQYKSKDDWTPEVIHTLQDTPVASDWAPEEKASSKVLFIPITNTTLLHVYWPQSGEEENWKQAIHAAAKAKGSSVWNIDSDKIYLTSNKSFAAGHGSKVILGVYNNQRVAVKICTDAEQFENEKKILCTLKHQNILPLVGLTRINSQNALILPYMKLGSLSDYNAKNHTWLTWGTVLRIGLEVAEAFHYLHTKDVTHQRRPILHLDLKSSNILLNSCNPTDPRPMIQLSDFGDAWIQKKSGPSLDTRGDSHIKPEDEAVTPKWDVWQFGLLLAELSTLCSPEVVTAAEFLLDHVIKSLPKQIAELVAKCLEKSAAKRPTFEAVIPVLKRCLFDFIRSNTAQTHVLQLITSASAAVGPTPTAGEASDLGGVCGRPKSIHLTSSGAAELWEVVDKHRTGALVFRGAPGSGLSSILRCAYQYKSYTGYLICNGSWEKSPEAFSAIRKALRHLIDGLLGHHRLLFEGRVKPMMMNENLRLDDLLNYQRPISTEMLQTALAKLIQAIADEVAPLLIALDNLQYADQPSLDLLKTLLTKESTRLTAILTTSGESTRLPFDASEHEIHPLGTELVSSILEEYQIENDLQLATVLQETTKGKPFEIHQAMQYLHEQDKLAWDRSRKKWTLKEAITPKVISGALFRTPALQIAALLFEPINLEVVARAMLISLRRESSVRSTLLRPKLGLTSSQLEQVRVEVEAAMTRAKSLNLISDDLTFVATNLSPTGLNNPETNNFRQGIIKALSEMLSSGTSNKPNSGTVSLRSELVQQQKASKVPPESPTAAKAIAKDCYIVAMNILASRGALAGKLLKYAYKLLNLGKDRPVSPNWTEEIALDVTIARVRHYLKTSPEKYAEPLLSRLVRLMPKSANDFHQATIYALEARQASLHGNVTKVLDSSAKCLKALQCSETADPKMTVPEIVQTLEQRLSKLIFDSAKPPTRRINAITTRTSSFISQATATAANSSVPALCTTTTVQEFALAEEVLLLSMRASCALKAAATDFETATMNWLRLVLKHPQFPVSPYGLCFYANYLANSPSQLTSSSREPSFRVYKVAHQLLDLVESVPFQGECAFHLVVNYRFGVVEWEDLLDEFDGAIDLALGSGDIATLTSAIAVKFAVISSSGLPFTKMLKEIDTCQKILAPIAKPQVDQLNQILGYISLGYDSPAHDFIKLKDLKEALVQSEASPRPVPVLLFVKGLTQIVKEMLLQRDVSAARDLVLLLQNHDDSIRRACPLVFAIWSFLASHTLFRHFRASGAAAGGSTVCQEDFNIGQEYQQHLFEISQHASIFRPFTVFLKAEFHRAQPNSKLIDHPHRFSKAQVVAEVSNSLHLNAMSHEAIMEITTGLGALPSAADNRRDAARHYHDWGALKKAEFLRREEKIQPQSVNSKYLGYLDKLISGLQKRATVAESFPMNAGDLAHLVRVRTEAMADLLANLGSPQSQTSPRGLYSSTLASEADDDSNSDGVSDSAQTDDSRASTWTQTSIINLRSIIEDLAFACSDADDRHRFTPMCTHFAHQFISVEQPRNLKTLLLLLMLSFESMGDSSIYAFSTEAKEDVNKMYKARAVIQLTEFRPRDRTAPIDTTKKGWKACQMPSGVAIALHPLQQFIENFGVQISFLEREKQGKGCKITCRVEFEFEVPPPFNLVGILTTDTQLPVILRSYCEQQQIPFQNIPTLSTLNTLSLRALFVNVADKMWKDKESKPQKVLAEWRAVHPQAQVIAIGEPCAPMNTTLFDQSFMTLKVDSLRTLLPPPGLWILPTTTKKHTG